MTTEAGKPKEANESLAAVERRLEKQLRGIVANNRIVLVVGVVLAIIIVAYLGVIISKLESFVREPRTMATWVMSPINAHVLKGIETFKAQALHDAPTLIAQGRKQLMEALPELRKKYGRRVAQTVVKELAVNLKAQLRPLIGNVIQENRDALDAIINKAVQKDGAEQLKAEFERAFAKELGKWLDDEVAKVNKKLDEYTEYLVRLRTAKNLTAIEQAEKEWIVASLKVVADAMDTAAKDSFGAKKAEKEGQ